MQRSFSTIETSSNATGLRGKRLPPIQTKFTKDASTQTLRPQQVQVSAQDDSSLISEPLAPSRRQSRKLLGLFDRSKSQKDISQPRDSLDIIRPSFDKRSIQVDVKKSNHLQKKRPQSKEVQVKPPTFAQALSKAAKRITLAVPVTDADDLLKIRKHQQESSILEEEAGEHAGNGTNDLRGAAPAFLPTNWMACIFILTTGGLLLQYSAIGLSDRLPQRFIQLTGSSTASASDAVVGRRWVVQVTQSTNDGLSSGGARSRLSRIGSRSAKASKSCILLVMENPKQMDSWLIALKSEIAVQGSKAQRSEALSPRKSTSEAIRSRESSDYAFRNKKGTTSASYHSHSAVLQDKKEPITILNFKNNQREYSQQIDNDSIPTANSSPIEVTRGILRESKNHNASPEISVSKALARPLLEWELPANFSPTFSSSSLISGFLINILDTDIPQDHQTAGQYSPSIYSASIASDGAPNFSVPTFSHRFSHSTKSGTIIITPPRSSGSSINVPLPLGTDKNVKEMYNVASLPLIVTPSTPRKASQHSIAYHPDFDQDWSEPAETIRVSLEDDDDDKTILPRPPSSLLFSKGLEAIARGVNSSQAITPRNSLSLNTETLLTTENPLGISYIGKAMQPSDTRKTAELFPVPPRTRKVSMPQVSLTPMSSSDEKKSRPHSLQPPSAATQLHKKVSSKTLQPTPSARPMTLRERRSFTAVPTHLLGPPTAPPPTEPLPAIPKAAAVLASS